MSARSLAATLASVVLVSVTVGCILGSSDDGTEPDVGSAGTGRVDAAAGGAAGSADGGSGASTGDKACPAERGPRMAMIQSPGGTACCIDTTEVTQDQYAKFLAGVTTKPGDEHPMCAGQYGNTTIPMRARVKCRSRITPLMSHPGPTAALRVDRWHRFST